MKRFFVTVALLSLPWPAFAQLADMVELPEEFADENSGYSEEELLKSWGWLLAERFNLKDLELTDREMAWIAEGMEDHVRGVESATNLRESQYSLQEYFAKREADIRARQLEQNRRRGQEFFDSLVGLPDINSLGTGLCYQILRKGSDVKPDGNDTVIVRYEGRFLDNTVFDSTAEKGPAAFKLNEVIDGWNQGIQLIGEGGKIKLYVPSDLGYGDEGRPGIPPASTLVFEIELLKVGLPENPEEEGVDVLKPAEGGLN